MGFRTVFHEDQARRPRQVRISTHGAGWRESAIDRWIADPVDFRPETLS